MKLNLTYKWKGYWIEHFLFEKKYKVVWKFQLPWKKLFLKHLKWNLIWLFEIEAEIGFDTIKMKKRQKKGFAAFSCLNCNFM